MGDIQLALLIQVAAFAFLLFPFAALLRGYFQGISYMLPSALSQISEQLLRVAVLLGLSFWIVKEGYSLYAAGAAAASGSLAGSMAALILLCLFWFKAKKVENKNSEQELDVVGTTAIVKNCCFIL